MAKKQQQDTDGGRPNPKHRLGVKTVVKPCLIGAVLLSIAQAALPHSL